MRIYIVINYETLQPHIFIEEIPKNSFKIAKLLTTHLIRPNPNIKDDVWINKRKEAMKLIKDEVNEVLIFNDQGILTEGLSSNFFYIKNGTFYTPSTNLCLDGTLREIVIQVCKNNNYKVVESQNITLDDIYQADEVFVCSTSRYVIFADQIDQKILQNRNEEFEQKFFNLVKDEVNNQCQDPKDIIKELGLE